MASSENTAINELIARVSGGQTSIEAPAEAPAAAESLPRVPASHGAQLAPPAGPRKRPISALPVTPTPIPIAAPPAMAHGDRRVAQAWRPPRGAWSERTQLVRPRKRAPFGGIAVGKLVLPMVLLVIAGTVIGGYVVFRGGGELSSREVAAVSAPETTPAVNPAPVVAEPKVPEPTPASPANVEPAAAAETAARPAMLVDVRIDSTPSGATVTLVDRGTPQFVGTTPVNATVDASREYDLVFTYPNKATWVEHLDASATRRVAVTLGAGGRERHEVHEEASR